MRAYRLESFNNLEALRLSDEPDPKPQRGEVLVRIRATSLNYRDIAILRGRYPRKSIPGLIPISDAAGDIVDIGEGGSSFRVGDRVIGAFHPRWFGGEMPTTIASDSYGAESDGWLCELKALSQEAVVRMPSGLTYEEAATLPCAGLTAWTALTGTAAVRPGHTVLILGSGGVSIFALQLAVAMGAKVIATTSSSAKAGRLTSLGASAVVNYVDEAQWGQKVRALTNGRGVDRVVEVGGAGTISQSLKAVAIGGEIASIGFLSVDNPGIDFFQLKASGATIRNVTVGDRTSLFDLCRAVSSIGVKPIIDRLFEFDQAREAFAYLESGRHFGKVVIRCPN